MCVRLVPVYIIFAAMTLLLAGCGDSASETGAVQPEDTGEEPQDGVETQDAGEEEAEGAEEAPDSDPIEPTTLRIAHAWPLTSQALSVTLLRFLEHLEELSGGAIEVELFGPDTMPATEIHEAVGRGSVDLGLTSAGYYTHTIPEALALNLTTLTSTEWRERGIYDIVNEWHEAELNQHVLGRLSEGQHYALYTNERIESLDDFEGMRIRGTPFYAGLLNELGAELIDLPPDDIYTALERGTVDGLAWIDMGIIEWSFHEVVDYMILPQFYEGVVVLNVNIDTWESLSDAQRDVITEAVIKTELESPTLMNDLREEEYAVLAEAGVEFIELSPEDAEEFQRMAVDGLVKYLEEFGVDPAILDPFIE